MRRPVMRNHLGENVMWRATSEACFPWAAAVHGEGWVLRVNDFPDHPLYTLFVRGERARDLDDAPTGWTFLEADYDLNDVVVCALQAVASFEAYGSEAGTPCDGLCCVGLRAGT